VAEMKRMVAGMKRMVAGMKRMVAGMKKRYKMILILYGIYLFRRFFTFGKKYATDLGITHRNILYLCFEILHKKISELTIWNYNRFYDSIFFIVCNI